MNLSEHFTLEELAHSQIAARRGIDNAPPLALMDNLRGLAAGLELVRSVVRCPMFVSSGYRCHALNRAIGGSSMSAHCEGWAADFIAPYFGTPQVVARAILASDIPFDQVIFEGDWVHLSFDPRTRRLALTAHFHGGPATYTQGIA